MVLIVGILVVVGFVVYFKIMNRGKKCKCGAKYDSSCIQNSVMTLTSKAGEKVYSDHLVTVRCKKCGKVEDVKVTLRTDDLKPETIDYYLKRHFDK